MSKENPFFCQLCGKETMDYYYPPNYFFCKGHQPEGAIRTPDCPPDEEKEKRNCVHISFSEFDEMRNQKKKREREFNSVKSVNRKLNHLRGRHDKF